MLRACRCPLSGAGEPPAPLIVPSKILLVSTARAAAGGGDPVLLSSHPSLVFVPLALAASVFFLSPLFSFFSAWSRPRGVLRAPREPERARLFTLIDLLSVVLLNKTTQTITPALDVRGRTGELVQELVR